MNTTASEGSRPVFSTSISEELDRLRAESKMLKRRIDEAINIIEFHKHLSGEEYVRQRILKKLRGTTK